MIHSLLDDIMQWMLIQGSNRIDRGTFNLSFFFYNLCSFSLPSDGVAVLAGPQAEWAGVWQFTAVAFLPDAVQRSQRGGLSRPGFSLGNHQLQSLQVRAAGRAEDRWRPSLQVRLLSVYVCACVFVICYYYVITMLLLCYNTQFLSKTPMQNISGCGDVTVPWSDAEVCRKRPVLYQQHAERTTQTVPGSGFGGLTKGDFLLYFIRGTKITNQLITVYTVHISVLTVGFVF